MTNWQTFEHLRFIKLMINISSNRISHQLKLLRYIMKFRKTFYKQTCKDLLSVPKNIMVEIQGSIKYTIQWSSPTVPLPLCDRPQMDMPLSWDGSLFTPNATRGNIGRSKTAPAYAPLRFTFLSALLMCCAASCVAACSTAQMDIRIFTFGLGRWPAL